MTAGIDHHQAKIWVHKEWSMTTTRVSSGSGQEVSAEVPTAGRLPTTTTLHVR
jgi:hypothetical protein